MAGASEPQGAATDTLLRAESSTAGSTSCSGPVSSGVGAGDQPTVFLAALGDLATHTARSTWITNLLAVAGVVAAGAEADGSMSPAEAQARFAESGSPVAVVCSSDGVYAEQAAATATALKEAGAVKVVLAGAPGDLRDELDRAGVDEYWHVGIDVLDALQRLHGDLGI